MSKQYEQLLLDTALVLGVDPQGFAEVESFTVEGLQINMMYRAQETDETVAVFVLLGQPDRRVRNKVLETMANGNALWSGTDGCTVGIQAESGEMIVACEQPLEWLTTQRFLAL